jgi:cyclic pyranopterin phosphate synthase
MVDVTSKNATVRVATAVSTLRMSPTTFNLLTTEQLPKGELFATVRLAAIQGAKQTSNLIPLSHPLNLTHVDVKLDVTRINHLDIIVTATCREATGVEMEALCGASIGALTAYDMIKAVDKEASIINTQLLRKTGGKSGDFSRYQTIAEGKVESINTSDRKGVKKTPIPTAKLCKDYGIEGDAHAEPGNIRQLSLLSLSAFETMRNAGVELESGDFGENITFSGFTYTDIQIGDRIQLADAELEITKIGKECHDGCWIKQKVGDCVMPREGFFCRILTDSTVKPGDSIILQRKS